MVEAEPPAVVVGTDFLTAAVEVVEVEVEIDEDDDAEFDASPFGPLFRWSLRSTSRQPPSRATRAASGPQPVTAVTSLRASVRTVSSEKASIEVIELDSSSSSDKALFLSSLLLFLSLSAGEAEAGGSEGGI